MASGTAAENAAGFDVTKYVIIAGDIFVGAMSSTQRNIFDKKSECYNSSAEFRTNLVDEIFTNGLDFSTIVNNA